MLSRIESTMAAIKTKLLSDETIRKLLFHDSNNALNMPAPRIEQVEKYITLKPIYDFENKEDYSQNSVINIHTTQAMPGGESKIVNGALQINVVCNEEKWELINSKIRPMQICNTIIKLIDNCKFTVSNKIVFDAMTDLIISKKLFGYALLFAITDGSEEKEKF